MKQIILLLAVFLCIHQIKGDCGCLKCSKDLHVVSPPNHPYQIIVKGASLTPPTYLPPQTIDFELSHVCPPVLGYRYQVQQPIVPPPLPPILPVTGLVAKPDRVVIQAPACPVYVENGCPPPAPVAAPLPPPPAPRRVQGPILEPLPSDFFNTCQCLCRVTEVENDVEPEELEEEETLSFAESPLHFLLDAPIRFFKHFHNIGKQINPVFKNVPSILINSKNYLRSMRRNIRNDVLNFASNFIGDFEDINSFNNRLIKPRRFRRNANRRIEDYEPEYSLVFNESTAGPRKKRYILKVVDEEEVEEFLREKLEGYGEEPKQVDSSKKKLVVEQLSPKIILDKKGRTFLDINGSKRPLFLKKKPKEQVEEQADMKEKINSIIIKARERISQSPIVGSQQTVPNQMIKERINQILLEVQNLVTLDFNKYSSIFSDLCKLQTFKESLVKEWKAILMENRSNDIASKIKLLDDFKELQILRDKAVEEIASILTEDSSFMTKKLIKMLVRLQKLQCIIYKVVEDFDEKIKTFADFDEGKEIKYVDYLTNLNFVQGQSKQSLETELKNERDEALEKELKILDSLRKISDQEKCHEEAQILWEIKNIDKLQKDTVREMNEKILRGLKVRKELKILFDLLGQLENCEERQEKLLEDLKEDKSEESVAKPKHRKRILARRPPVTLKARTRASKTTKKQPFKLVSDGFTLTAYKV